LCNEVILILITALKHRMNDMLATITSNDF